MLDADVDRIVDDILKSRRISEGAAFSSRVYSDRPILTTGKRLREQQAAPGEPSTSLHGSRQDGGAAADAVVRVPRAVPAWKGSSHGRLAPDLGSPGATPARPEMPERYRQMAELARDAGSGRFAYRHNRAALLFYRQARLMEDWEDDYDYHGQVVQYFPTYDALSIGQLRGYFSWRARLRAGHVDSAPLSFAFLHAYELLCGIGTTPGEQGLADLRAFHLAFRETATGADRAFDDYLRLWAHDYVIYHGLDPQLCEYEGRALDDAVCTLFAAQAQVLSDAGLPVPVEPRIAPRAVEPPELLEALCAAGRYHMERSAFFRSQPELAAAVASATFSGLVRHCARRRKVSYMEGLFGHPYATPYLPYRAAVFHDPQGHADVRYRLNDAEAYVCQDGRWTRLRSFSKTERSRELGETLRSIDRVCRERTGYPHKLKPREERKFVLAIIEGALDEMEAREQERKRREIHIDLSQLDAIRSSAAWATEALLVDEERGELPISAPASAPCDALAASVHEGTPPLTSDLGMPADGGTLTGEPSLDASPASREPAQRACDQRPVYEASTAAASSTAPGTAGGADDDSPERRVVRALLAGQGAQAVLRPGDPFLSVVVESINERLFDLLGDAAIEDLGDGPQIVPDYLPDLKEAYDL